MLIFSDLLRKHNDVQPKYIPPSVLIANQQQQKQTVAAASGGSERRSISYSSPSVSSVSPGQAAASKTSSSYAKPISQSNSTASSTARRLFSGTGSQVSRASHTGSLTGAKSSPSSSGGSKIANNQPLSTSSNVSSKVSAINRIASSAIKFGALKFGAQSDRNHRHHYHRASEDFNVHSTQSSQTSRSQPVASQDALKLVRPEQTVKLPLIKGLVKLVSSKQHRSSSERLQQVRRQPESSSPSVSHAPGASLGQVATQKAAAAAAGQPDSSLSGRNRKAANIHLLTGHVQHKPAARDARTSMAKTIAEQTPNAFETLGPGFNNRVLVNPAEKSFNSLGQGGGKSGSSAGGGSLASSMMPSDYEHIFHAPSQINGLDEGPVAAKKVPTVQIPPSTRHDSRPHSHSHPHHRDKSDGGHHKKSTSAKKK